NCKEKASFFLIVFFNLLILCQKLLIQRYNLLRIIPQQSIRYITLFRKDLEILCTLKGWRNKEPTQETNLMFNGHLREEESTPSVAAALNAK
ncbi:hypothetical protein, partial [Piscirickettsia salmonis]|uniref:hypothetical protein n=1 Tax=Piscirickettsia salmonis TaxID=1238 RepID=UPI00050A0628